MKTNTQDLVEKLKLKNASKHMGSIGRMLVNNDEKTLWELDTAKLPRSGRKWRKKARNFAENYLRPIAQEVDNDTYNYDYKPLFKEMAKQGFLTALLPQPLGSAPLSLFRRNATFLPALMAEEFCAVDGGLGLNMMAPHLGIAALLLSGDMGTYRKFLIPQFFKTKWFGNISTLSYGATEPNAGSDVLETEGGAFARIATVAERVKGGYILNGSKVFISNGKIADRVVVFAKLKGENLDSWTAFLVEKSREGFQVGNSYKKMGQKASDASELFFNDVFVPMRNRIGNERAGWPLNRNTMNFSRAVVGAIALGGARGSFESALKFCRNNELGSKRLIDHKDIQAELSDMAIQIMAIRSLVWNCFNHFRTPQSISSAAKVFASDKAFEISGKAMDLLGEFGFMQSTGIERLWRDIRLTQLYEGTNEVNRLAFAEFHWDTDFNV